MNRYTTYCTAEQTKKALELGAPIGKICFALTDSWQDEIPTAEQMRGWLKDKGCRISVYESSRASWSFFIKYKTLEDEIALGDCIAVEEEATLAAIDAALDYLSNNKK